ncbi:MAG TPA: Ig-like domain-containing protein [Longimicrobiales bacterium]|nr:Ig-like domain-containing protein [Longimicrobiales bacterium]
MRPLVSPGRDHAPIPRLARLGRFQWVAGALLSGALVFGACEGDNMFSGNPSDAQPRVVGISASPMARAGDTLHVQVSAFGARQITRLNVMLRGALSRDTAIDVEPNASVVQDVKFALPLVLTDSLVVVTAGAVDKAGAASKFRSDTVPALAPPQIVSMAGPDTVTAGTPATFSIHAVGFHRVSRLVLALRGAVSRDTTVQLATPATDVTQPVLVAIPIFVGDTVLRMDVSAVDETGVQGAIVQSQLPVAIGGPEIVSFTTTSDTVVAGKTLDFRVQARSPRKVASFKVSTRGAVVTDQTVAVAPPRTDVTQDISLPIPASVQDSVLTLQVSAIDGGGTPSVVRTRTIFIPTSAPVVTAVTAPDSIRPGSTLDVRVTAKGSRPIAKIDLMLRGAIERDLSATPLRNDMTDVTQDFPILLPDTMKDTLLVVGAKATDQAGAVSAVLQRTIRIRDTGAPTVALTLGSTSANSGQKVDVKVSAKDNVGLTKVGYKVTDPSNAVLADVQVNASGRTKDTTFVFTVPAGAASTLTVRATATDGSGLIGQSAPATIAVTDKSNPTVTILSPVDNATFPLGDSVAITARVSDGSGIKTVTYAGVALRGGGATDVTVVNRFQPKTVSFPQPPSQALPTDTTFTRYLVAIADTVSEQVRLIVTATDSANNTSTDTAYVFVGGPRVDIRTPTNGGPTVNVNTAFQVKLFAVDNSAGVDSVRLDLSGAMTGSIRWRTNSPDSVVIDTTLTPTATGTVTLNAYAWNRRGIGGRVASPVSVLVVTSGGGADVQRPQIRLNVSAAPRMELGDSVVVNVTAQDNGTAGVKRVGILAFVRNNLDGLPSDTVPVALDSAFATPQAGQPGATFRFALKDFHLDEATLTFPQNNARMEFFAFAVDAAGNCGASVSASTLDSVPCAYALASPATDSFYTASGRTGFAQPVQIVPGHTVMLPNGGKIADATVDFPRKRIYLSNIQQNKIDILKLADTTFVQTGVGGVGLVGSQPWGITLDNSGDTLIVANSGSTNISFVPVSGAAETITELVSRRLLTPNEVLFEVKSEVSAGRLHYTASFYDFSDRPQFIAQDVQGRLVYSTVPTGSAPDGTVRFAIQRTAPQVTEPKLLFNNRAITPDPNIVALAYIDSIRVVPGGGAVDDQIILYDHDAGYPNSVAHVIAAGPTDISTAMATLAANPNSDMKSFAGRWDIAKIGMTDTTFIAASGDRSKIAVGEGATNSSGRIMMWDGGAALGSEQVSNEVSVSDLVNNASERVFGVGLNSNGTFGVARGSAAAYFFTPDLRLQGLFTEPATGGGAALHPSNNAPSDQVNGLAFVPTDHQTIKILDSVHYYLRGELPIRDKITGALKASLPFPGENGALPATDPNYIVAKLYGVTSSGGVVIVDVRNRDLVN